MFTLHLINEILCSKSCHTRIINRVIIFPAGPAV